MDQGTTVDRALSRSVLVLGAQLDKREDSQGLSLGSNIGGAIVHRLNELGHLCFAPTQATLDVTKEPDEDDGALLSVLEECRPDSVVYSVGINELEWSWALDREAFERIMRTNVWGFINVLKALQTTGQSYSVLAITSDAARRPMRTSMAYCASKAALDQVIRVASRELAGEGWRINGLAPGKVDGTPMTRYVDGRVMQIRHFETREEAERYEMAGNPLRRKLTVREVAAVACDILLSDAGGWTGDIINVNGGR